MTADNPYSGVTGQHIVNYQAGRPSNGSCTCRPPIRCARRRTRCSRCPTTTSRRPDRTSRSTVRSRGTTVTTRRTSTSPGRRSSGPGVAANGVNGPQPAGGNEASDPNSTNTVPQASRHGTYVDEVDLRPTLLHLAGLTDDYPTDGTVVDRRAQSARARAALGAVAGGRIPAAQLERRRVRHGHLDRLDQRAQEWLGVGRLDLHPGRGRPGLPRRQARRAGDARSRACSPTRQPATARPEIECAR